MVLSIALLSVVQLSVQGLSSLSASLPWLSFVKTLTTSLCSALLFLLFSFPPTSLGLVLSLSLPCLSYCLSVSGCTLTAIKRLPFMRNRSKDKDKAKAIYRRSMCKTSVGRHASPPPPPLPLIVTLGETKEQSLISGWLQCGGVTVTVWQFQL